MGRDMKHLQIRVLGKVQGVWFRKNALQQAQQLKITGFVKNQTDGSVLIEAEGKDENLKKFLDWCEKGPPQAEVEQLFIREGDIECYDSFDIREG